MRRVGITVQYCRIYCTNTTLFFLAGCQVLAQELGVGDAFDVEMDVADLGGRLGMVLLLIVFLEEVVLQYI